MRRANSGQAVLEYILLIVMIAVTMAVTIRASNINIYRFWTGLARMVAMPCPECVSDAPPDLP